MNAYLDVIMNALLVFPLMAMIFTLPYIIYNYRKYGSVFSMRILIVYSFVLYLLCAYFLVILPLPSMQEVELMSGPSTQLIPLHFLADIVKETPSDQPFSFFSLLHNRALLQMLFNIMMTIPFGIYLRYYFRCSFRKCVLYTFLLSLFFELTQLSGLYFIYPRSYRLFDVDDLLGNTLGGIIGYGIIQPFLRLLPARAQLDRRSYERGMSVSFGRRLIAFIADLLVMTLLGPLLYGMLAFLRLQLPSSALLLFCGYFALTPILLHGQTPGMRFMRFRVIALRGRLKWWQPLLRYALSGAFLLLPWLFDQIAQMLQPSGVPLNLFIRAALGIVYLLMLGRMTYLAGQGRMLFFERISGTRLKNLIRS